MNCRCMLCLAREAGVSPLEYSYKDDSTALKLLQRFPGYEPGSVYGNAAKYEKYIGRELTELEFILNKYWMPEK